MPLFSGSIVVLYIKPVYIMLEDTYYSMQLTIEGTTIFNNIVISSDKKTHDYSKIIAISSNPWNLANIQFNAK